MRKQYVEKIKIAIDTELCTYRIYRMHVKTFNNHWSVFKYSILILTISANEITHDNFLGKS